MTDDMILAGIPDSFAISGLLKSVQPAEEAGERYVYLEASNEDTDLQNEKVLAKALADSADYFLKFGNLDIDHLTQIGHRSGIANPEAYEIGQPCEVKVEGGSTFVKGRIYAGEGDSAAKANYFWSSITSQSPPAKWYPSVGGSVLSKSVSVDEAGNKTALVTKVRWTNIGFSKTPVNTTVKPVTMVPFGALSKSYHHGGFDLKKALEAGYGTDSSALAGGGALRRQSLEPKLITYWNYHHGLAQSLRARETEDNPKGWLEYGRRIGLKGVQALKYAERYMSIHNRGQ